MPLWSLFDRVKDVGHPEEEMLSVYREYGVVRKESRDDNFNKTAENRNIYQLIEPGWLVVNRMKAWQGSVGVSNYRGIVSGHYICFRPRHSEDPRFLNYLLRSPVYAAELRHLSRGVRPNQIEIDNDWLRVLPVRLPPIDTQRAIADYLDAETARIDALIEKKQRMADSLRGRERSVLDLWAEAQFESHPSVAFRRMLRGIEQGWSPQCEAVPAEPAEWGVLKTSAVSSGAFRPEENKRLPGAVVPELRWVVREGDLLMTRGSGSRAMVGQAVVAHPGDRHLMLSDLTYRLLAVNSDPDYLAAMLRSSRVRGELESMIRTDTGMTLKVRVDDIKALSMPLTPVDGQRMAAQDLRKKLAATIRPLPTIEHQTSLIREHRQALITAAVTGDLEVPGVAA
ncbi:MAG: restriction endonuclease subunit S [Acidobacteriota bacterium]|nr:restriction endonuclease subunit S [Acidobacteriota bacterium]